MRLAKLPHSSSFRIALMNKAKSSSGTVIARCVHSTMQRHSSSNLQKLYETAKHLLAGGRVPSPEEVKELRKSLSSVPLEELGLDISHLREQSAKGVHRRAMWPLPNPVSLLSTNGTHNEQPPIQYFHIHEEPDLTIGIFCLPSNATIPLHNHPGMTVFSRLLYGTMRLRAYDWVDSSNPAQDGSLQPARLVTSQQLTAPEEPMALFPTSGGNIHTFQAITDCAVLDVLAPPYSPESGRDCTYYREHLPAEVVDDNGELVVIGDDFPVIDLEVCDPPPDFRVVAAPYQGLRIRAVMQR